MANIPYKVYSSEKELEAARLREAANATYTERFYKLMKLIKISNTVKQMKIVSSPQIKEE
jgi:hypothetical protein